MEGDLQRHVDISFDGRYRFLLRLIQPFFVKYLKNKIKDASDFIISGQAGMIHDSSDVLGGITMPTLVIGGTKDPFFPEALFYEMSEKIKDCELLIVKGARHLVLEEHQKQCLRAMAAFLKGATNPDPITALSEAHPRFSN